jgi:hypothetical protein
MSAPPIRTVLWSGYLLFSLLVMWSAYRGSMTMHGDTIRGVQAALGFGVVFGLLALVAKGLGRLFRRRERPTTVTNQPDAPRPPPLPRDGGGTLGGGP